MDVTAIGRDYLKGAKGKPLFLFLHYWDPHGPYTPPQEYLDKHKDTPYAGEVAYTDAAIGELLKDLKKNGLYEDATIVFFSDHGEGLGDHGEAQHSFYLYNSTMAVPFAIKVPRSMQKSIRSRSVTETVSIMDLFPTLCDLYRLPAPKTADGISLAPLMRGKKGAAGHAELFLESEMPRHTFGWEVMHGLIRWPLKAVICSEPQVFDLQKDFAESQNLYPRDYMELNKAASTALATASASKAPGQLNPEEARRLLSLGYFLPGSASKKAATLPPSKWPLFIEINRLGDIARWADDYKKAVEEYTKFLKEYPDNARVYMERAWAYQEMDDLPAAVADLEKALVLNPENFEVYEYLFQAYRRMGDQKKYHALAEIVKKKFAEYLFLIPVADGLLWENKLDEALALLKKGMDENPNNTAAYLKYLNVLMFQKRQKDAEDFSAKVIAGKAGQKIVAMYFSGMQAMIKGDQAKALSFLNDACYYGADFYQPYFYSGLIYKGMKDLPNATKYFNAARILAAEDPQVHYEWADILATQGQFPQALGGFLTALRYEPSNPIIHIAVMKVAWAMQKKDITEREFNWLAKNAPDVLTSVRAQDPILQQMLK
jgi:tetratricopeptide (TPR) repeat protein